MDTPEQISRTDWLVRRKLISWLVCEAAGDDKAEQIIKYDKKREDGSPDPDVVDTFVLTVNGVQLPLLETIEKLEKFMEESSAQSAYNILKADFDLTQEKIQAMREDLLDKFRRNLEEKYKVRIDPDGDFI
jgi:hypothetical protein